MNFKHVIFDIDGTLIDDGDAVFDAYIKTALICTGKTISRDFAKSLFSTSTPQLLKALNIDDYDYGSKVLYDCLNEFILNAKPFNGVVEIIDILVKNGIKVGICTNRNIDEVNANFNYKGLEHDKFSLIVTRDKVTKPKPNPDPFVFYCDYFNLKSEDVLYLGDTEADYISSSSAGVKFGLCLWSNPLKCKANYYLDKPEDILKIVGIEDEI